MKIVSIIFLLLIVLPSSAYAEGVVAPANNDSGKSMKINIKGSTATETKTDEGSKTEVKINPEEANKIKLNEEAKVNSDVVNKETPAAKSWTKISPTPTSVKITEPVATPTAVVAKEVEPTAPDPQPQNPVAAFFAAVSGFLQNLF